MDVTPEEPHPNDLSLLMQRWRCGHVGVSEPERDDGCVDPAWSNRIAAEWRAGVFPGQRPNCRGLFGAK